MLILQLILTFVDLILDVLDLPSLCFAIDGPKLVFAVKALLILVVLLLWPARVLIIVRRVLVFLVEQCVLERSLGLPVNLLKLVLAAAKTQRLAASSGEVFCLSGRLGRSL